MNKEELLKEYLAAADIAFDSDVRRASFEVMCHPEKLENNAALSIALVQQKIAKKFISDITAILNMSGD